MVEIEELAPDDITLIVSSVASTTRKNVPLRAPKLRMHQHTIVPTDAPAEQAGGGARRARRSRIYIRLL